MLYLIRHGAARPVGDDDERALTSQGIAEVRELALRLKRDKVLPGMIWHSHKRRAIETASLLAEGLGCAQACRLMQGLGPDASPGAVLERIEAFFIEAPSASLVIVSHLPFLPMLANELMPGCCSSGMTLPTAGCWALERAGENWHIDFTFSPGGA